MVEPAPDNAAQRARFRLQLEPGAGAWLQAMPSSAIGNSVNPRLFVTMLQRRLGMRIFGYDFYCPYCDGVCDAFGDHCLSCVGGGDRTVRHNLLRNQSLHICNAAGLHPELEKPGLLRPRPFIGSQEEDSEAGGLAWG